MTRGTLLYVIFILCLAILSAFITIAGMLSSIIQKWVSDQTSGAEEEHAAAEQKATESDQLQPGEIVRAFPAHIDAVANAINAYHNKRDTHERRKTQTEKVTITVLGVTALFALVAVFVSGISDWIFYAQLNEMQAEQRPWVGMAEIRPVGDGNGGVSYNVIITNSGRSPAFRVNIFIGDWHQDPKAVNIPTERCTTDCRAQNLEILPGSANLMAIPKAEQLKPRIGETAWIVIRIDYDDSEGGSHKTGICSTVVVNQIINATNRADIAITEDGCPTPNSNYAD